MRVSKKLSSLIAGAVVLAALAIAGALTPATIPDSAPQDGTYAVVRVVDGDTIEVMVQGSKRKVRYIGINTPETVDPRRPVQCYGREASERNKELVEGKQVRLVRDVSETDKYARLLRYVYVGDTFVNLELVRQGYALASTYPPDIAYAAEFAAAEREAREEKLGLWSSTCSKNT